MVPRGPELLRRILHQCRGPGAGFLALWGDFPSRLGYRPRFPFSLVGILPAHAAMGAFFTATSFAAIVPCRAVA